MAIPGNLGVIVYDRISFRYCNRYFFISFNTFMHDFRSFLLLRCCWSRLYPSVQSYLSQNFCLFVRMRGHVVVALSYNKVNIPK
jgi:hypothetical protein